MIDLPELPADEVARNREAWCVALESGTYAQTNGVLRDEHGFCCLGVVEDVRGVRWFNESVWDRCVNFVDSTGRPLIHDDLTDWESPGRVTLGSDATTTSTLLSADGARWLGVRNVDPLVVAWGGDDDDYGDDWGICALSTLNDVREFTFAQIAAVVRDQLPTWNGRHNAAQLEARRRRRENVRRPNYSRNFW